MDALTGELLQPATRAVRAAHRPNEVDRLISTFRRRYRLFFIVAAVVFSAFAVMTLTSPPRYTATVTLLINERTPDVLHLSNLNSPQGDEDPTFSADSSAVDTQVEILRSRALAAGVIDQLHLDQDPDFNGAVRPPGGLSALKRKLLGQPLTAPVNPDPAARKRALEGVINAVMGRLEVKRTGLTYTIDLSFTDGNPDKAAAIANAFAQRYITQDLDSKFTQSSTATGWLDNRLTQLRDQANAADAAVQQYRIANNLMSAAGTNLTEQEITDLQTQLAQVREAGAEQDAQYRTAQHQLAAGSNGGDVSEALTNPVVQNLRAQQAAASAKLADLQAHYGDKYPAVINAKSELADITSKIQIEIERTLSNLKAQSDVVHTKIASLASSTDQARASLASNNRALVQLDALQSAADSAKAVYNAFLARYQTAVAKEGVQAPDSQVVSPAKPPTSPRTPNGRLDLAVAMVAGLVSGAFAIQLVEFLQPGFSTGADAEDFLDLPSLAELPTLSSTLDRKQQAEGSINPIDYVVDRPISVFCEAFRNLRAALVHARTGESVKVIAVTSALPGEGKTTTTLCLARTMALAGSRVMVVDGDLRLRSLSQALSINTKVGLLEVLNGTVTLEQALIRDVRTGMLILPLAKSSFTPHDVFGSTAMDKLLKQLRERVDYVLIDTAPLLAVADTRILCPKADAVLLLARWRKTPRNSILLGLRTLAADDTFVAGVALTQVNVREQARAGEGDGQYYRSYSKYYAN